MGWTKVILSSPFWLITIITKQKRGIKAAFSRVIELSNYSNPEYLVKLFT
jgi:hypothetical protein